MHDDDDRLRRWSAWYGPARFGLFLHWGQCTGGGDSSAHSWGNRPFKHPTMADFEAAAGEPERVARNLIALATRVGAGYITLTVYHTCDRFAVMYPTAVAGFRVRASRDYVGAVIDAGAHAGVRVLLYVPEAATEHWNTAGGPWIDPRLAGDAESHPLVFGIVDELVRRHGDRIAGFWLDGYHRSAGQGFAAFVHERLPEAVVVHNNDTGFSTAPDVAAIECTSGPCDPPYCRPSGLRKPHPEWGVLPPGPDFVEDIPTCNHWFHRDADAPALAASPYVTDPAFWVRELVSSLGQRRRWNHALGLGPREDGSAPPLFEPMLRTMAEFMAWAAPAIRGTMGGEGSDIEPGWWSHGAFGSVTRSISDPDRYHLFITTPPAGPRLRIPLRSRRRVREVRDLRTQRPVAFDVTGYLELRDADWSDVSRYGTTVLTVQLAART